MFKFLIDSDLECSLFSTYFLSTNNICPIVVSYFPVSVLASMHACAVCSWAFGTRPGSADGSLEIYIKKNKRKSAPICVHNNYFRK